MYFVYSGEVEVLSEGADFYCPKREDVLKAGDVFGMVQGLYPLQIHNYSYRALTIAVVLILKRQDWEYLLRSFPDSNHDIYERVTSLEFTI
ncbi:hypothetical protein L9F63_009380 [Diploptera punctata]|uniref:Cyclic nucleotide-binding domain-containing protein n=1 Tax=Diploptera punctata TaxID=6984 RepID=A0AAD8AJN7_DIPPU|nr:hypothetical protein L9F63_009380 [Diploptera punctata]